MARPKFDKRTYMAVKGMSQEKMFVFLHEVYGKGYEDGKNDHEGDNMHYMAIKRGVTYVCGNCEAELIIEDRPDRDQEI